jgi:hypothetical protein
MKKIPKDAAHTYTVKGERLIIILSWTKTESVAKNHYWLLIMNEYTHFLWSYFLKTKGEQVSVIIKHIKSLQNECKVKIKNICCDKSGENHDIQSCIREISQVKVQI